MIGWRKRKEKLVRGFVFVEKQDADADCLLPSHWLHVIWPGGFSRVLRGT